MNDPLRELMEEIKDAEGLLRVGGRPLSADHLSQKRKAVEAALDSERVVVVRKDGDGACVFNADPGAPGACGRPIGVDDARHIFGLAYGRFAIRSLPEKQKVRPRKLVRRKGSRLTENEVWHFCDCGCAVSYDECRPPECPNCFAKLDWGEPRELEAIDG